VNRITAILVLLFLLPGCGYFGRGNRYIFPDEQYSLPATTKPSSSGDSKQAGQAGEVRPSPSEPVRGASSGVSSTAGRIAEEGIQDHAVSSMVLRVNDEIITLEEIFKPVRQALIEAARGNSQEGFRYRAREIIHQQIQSRVNRLLLLAQANKHLTDAEKAWIESRVEKRLAQAILQAGSRTQLEQQLHKEGLTLEEWKKSLRDTMLIQMHLHRRLTGKVFVNREMMWKYYTTHLDEFSDPDKVQMQIISVRADEFLPEVSSPSERQLKQSREKARELIVKAAEALARGEDFAKVAKKFSRGPMAQSGGVWPMIERGSFRAQAVEETAFAQGPGKISKIIETPEGFYIVKTLAVQKGKKYPFERVQQKIKGKLRQQQFEKLARRYQAKLYSGAVILGLERFEQFAVESALQRYYHATSN